MIELGIRVKEKVSGGPAKAPERRRDAPHRDSPA